MDIFVGNIPFDTDPEELETLFRPHGTVERVHMPVDRETGRARGFTFTTMPRTDEAARAIADLNGRDCQGRPLRVNAAEGSRPQP